MTRSVITSMASGVPEDIESLFTFGVRDGCVVGPSRHRDFDKRRCAGAFKCNKRRNGNVVRGFLQQVRSCWGNRPSVDSVAGHRCWLDRSGWKANASLPCYVVPCCAALSCEDFACLIRFVMGNTFWDACHLRECSPGPNWWESSGDDT